MFNKFLCIFLFLWLSLAFSSTTENISSLNTQDALAETTLNVEELFSQISSENLKELSVLISNNTFYIPTSQEQVALGSPNTASTLDFISLPYNTVTTIAPEVEFKPLKFLFKKNDVAPLGSKDYKLKPITDEEDFINEKITTNDLWRDFSWDQYETKKEEVKITPYMSGFGEVKMYSLKVNGNRESAVKDATYINLLGKIKEVDFQIESRFNLLLQAKINEDAEVNYNIVQEPNMPQKTDVSLRIRKTYINFGTLSKTYTVGAFSNISKMIDGISVLGQEGSFKYNFGFGQSKSQTDVFTRTGSGASEYPLRNKPVLEGSLKVLVNNVQLVENVDYQVSYFEGKVIFKTPKNSQDNLSFFYDYTNPIEEFIPIASHVNFLGISGEYAPLPDTQTKPVYEEVKDSYFVVSSNKSMLLSHKPIKVGSEKVFAGNIQLVHNKDYYIHYSDGRLLLVTPLVTSLNIIYQTPQNIKRYDSFYGTDKQSVYYLTSKPIIEYSEEIKVQDIAFKKDVDYKIDYNTGKIFFLYSIPQTSKIVINYQQAVLSQVSLSPDDVSQKYKMQFGYFRQYAKAQKDINTKMASDTFNSTTLNNNTLVLTLTNWPIVPDSLAVVINNQPVSSLNMSIDLYRGTITINSLAGISISSSGNYSTFASYYYYKEYGPSVWYFTGSTSEMESTTVLMNNLNYSAHRLLSKTDQPVKYDRTNSTIVVEYKQIAQATFQTLVYGKDYLVSYKEDTVVPGQFYLTLLNRYSDNEGNHGVPDTLTAYDQFRIAYKYNKSNIPDPGDISHEQFEVAYQQNIAKDFDLSVDISKTAKEYSRSYQTTTSYLSPPPNGQYGFTYSLSNANIVENSDVVFINGQPNALKNENYYINYQTGKITFINLNPSPSDDVYVKYAYYTTESGENLKKVIKEGTALNLKTNYANSFSNSQFSFVKIDDNFMPLGSSPYPAGSNIYNFSTALSPFSNFSYAGSYFLNQKKLDLLSLSGTRLNQSEEKIMSEFGYKPLNELQLTYHFEREDNKSDIDNSTSANLRAVDNIGYRNNLALTAGPQYFLTTLALNQFNFRDNYLDQVNILDRYSRSWVVNNKASALDNMIQINSALSETNELDSTPSSYNQKLRETLYRKSSVQLTLKPISFVDINSQYSKETAETISSFDAKNIPASGNRTLTILQNYQYNVALYPPVYLYLVDNPNYQFSLANSEKASLLLNQEPDTNFSILNQYSWKFINLTTLSIKDSKSTGAESNKNINRETLYSEYGIGSFTLFNSLFPLQIQNSSKKFTKSKNSNNIPRDITLFTSGETNSTETKYGYSWQPFSFVRYDNDYYFNENTATSTENKTTELLQSFQTFPKQNTKQSLQLNFDEFFKTQYIHDYNLLENYKQTLSYATQNVESLNYTLFYNNSTHILNQSLNSIFFPAKAPIYLNIGINYDDYIDSAKGLKYRKNDIYSLNTTFPLMDFNLTPKVNLSKTLQYLKVSADISLNEMKNNRYDNYLYNRTQEGTLDAVKLLSSQFSLLMNYGYKRIQEDTQAPPPTTNSSAISVHSLGIGLQSYLLPNLSCSYVFNYKTNINEIINKSFQNYADTFILEYKPPQAQATKFNSSIVFTFRRDHSWGVGLNDFAKIETNQINAQSIATQITEINNITSVAIIAANIEIPMSDRSNGNIEKFVFTTEGNYVEKTDLMGNASGINYNYTITSLIFSGKLLF